MRASTMPTTRSPRSTRRTVLGSADASTANSRTNAVENITHPEWTHHVRPDEWVYEKPAERGFIFRAGPRPLPLTESKPSVEVAFSVPCCILGPRRGFVVENAPKREDGAPAIGWNNADRLAHDDLGALEPVC